MLSLHTNSASLSAVNAVSNASRAQSTAATRLSTGYRINSAMDDAAGLQIATRLRAQSSGMMVAQRNIQNGISLMQVADSVAGDMIAVFSRMRDLALQAADASTTQTDKAALQSEFVALYEQAWSTVSTKFAGQYLFVSTGGPEDDKFSRPINFQIGASSADVITPDLVTPATETNSSLPYSTADLADVLTAHASQAIDQMTTSIDVWSNFQSAVGAVGNMLEHAYNNLATTLTNTQTATGRITDTDYASETANETASQMLMQAGTSMLKQSSSLAQLTLSLVS